MGKFIYRNITFIAFVVSLLLLASCTGLKNVSEGKHLFTGYSINYDSVQFLAKKIETNSELDKLILLKPNKRFLWMRPFLSVYNMIPDAKKDSGTMHWIKHKLGEPPAYLEDINLQNINLAIENRLQNRGNFNAKSEAAVKEKRKTAKVDFFIQPEKYYTIDTVQFPIEKEGIEFEISKLQNKSLLTKGQIYSLSSFENERIRIDEALKELGYYYFKNDYLLFTADTSQGNRTIKTQLKLKPETPEEAQKAYRFNKIYILDDYSLRDYHPDTTIIGNYYYISQNHQFKPQTIINAVFLVKDSLYSRKNHYNTLRHMMSLGVYKFANVQFQPDDTMPGLMNVRLLLTPQKKISLSTELNAAIKSNNFAGPGITLNYKNRNFLRGAELFSVTLGSRFETQVSGDMKGQTSYEVTLDAALTLPRIVPFNISRKNFKAYVPNTIFATGLGIFSRVNLYKFNTFNVSAGYNWRSSERISHYLKPIEISYTNLAETTQEFEDYLDANPTVRKSFEEQFIIGWSYTFLNRNIRIKNSKHNLLLSESIDFSGNLISLFNRAINGSKPNSEEQYNLLGVPYSQFVRLRNEIRYFYIPNKAHQIGTRLIVGTGLPYGNSKTMPYMRQFFVGGTNSIRSFVARSVGPGSYNIPDSLSNVYIDQSGDIKLESSIEYRFGIYKFFKGALFMDVGNIWLINEDIDRPGSQFDFNTFYKELAVGSGVGFRFDFNIIVLRFDIAFPLCDPSLPEGQRWVVDEIDFSSQTWRRKNVIWNIAIGYSF